MQIEWCGELFELFAEGALLRLRDRSLILADLHFGKAASFRAAGVPVPAGTTRAQLQRLDSLVERINPAQILILGDLLHASSGRSNEMIDAFTQWRTTRANLAITLVRGNHDQRAGDPPAQWRVECTNEPACSDGLCLCHHPEEALDDIPTFAGHVHPGVAVFAGGLSALRVRCYFFSQRMAILPAFGVFTGMCLVQPGPGDRVFGIIDGEVVDLTLLMQQRHSD